MNTRLLVFATANLRRAAWQVLLEKQPGILVVGSTGEIAGLFAQPEGLQAQTLLVDMPDIQPQFVQELHVVAPSSGLLFLVDDYDLAHIVSLLRAGAAGFITYDSEVSELARAIIAAGRGEIVLPPSLAARALAALAHGEVFPKQAVDPLTEREHEVLGLLAQGLTNKDIAQTLFLSVRTVEAHLGHIYTKLDVATRTEAALWAVNHGYGNK